MNNQVEVALSNRHIHLTDEMFKFFFGDQELTINRYLTSDKRFFALEETVTLSGPKGSISNVRILGPARKYNQVELLKADTFILGIKAPIRDSGNLEGAADLTVSCNGKSILIPQCGIVALRHIHMVKEQMKELGVKENQFVSARIGGERGLTFDRVLIRRAQDVVSSMHIDIEEGNAANVKNGDVFEILV